MSPTTTIKEPGRGLAQRSVFITHNQRHRNDEL